MRRLLSLATFFSAGRGWLRNAATGRGRAATRFSDIPDRRGAERSLFRLATFFRGCGGTTTRDRTTAVLVLVPLSTRLPNKINSEVPEAILEIVYVAAPLVVVCAVLVKPAAPAPVTVPVKAKVSARFKLSDCILESAITLSSTQSNEYILLFQAH